MECHNGDMVPAENVQFLLNQLKKKFQNKTLVSKDFNVEVDDLTKKDFITEENQNIYEQDSDVEFELDYENGQIKMRSSTMDSTASSDKISTRGEIEFRHKMDILMTTFENETRRLDRKLEREKQQIQKIYEMKFETELQNKAENYSKMIKELKIKIEDMEKEHDEVSAVHEQEKRDIEQFYLKQIEGERVRLRQGIQKKLIKAKSEEWQKTKV